MDENGRQELSVQLGEVHTAFSDLAYKLRRELAPGSKVAKMAAKIERELFGLRRQLGEVDLVDASRRQPLAKVTRGGRPVDVEDLKSRE